MKKKTEQIGYFRKVNFLVKYFSGLGFDVEEQTPFKVSKKDVQELLFRCKQVLKDHSKAEKLLPTMSGFYFGDTEYNDWYFGDVKEVKEYIENELLPQFDNLSENEKIYFETWYLNTDRKYIEELHTK